LPCKNITHLNHLQKQKKKLYDFFKKTNLFSEETLNAFMAVPRELFVPEHLIQYSYIDEPLPITDESTISAISMSLLLCEYANLKRGKRVLEIGMGSGYQAALIAEIVCEKDENGIVLEDQEPKVFTIEIDKKVYEFGLENLSKTCYKHCIRTLLGDGTLGWPDRKIKFDAIIVTAAGDKIPPPLIKQLRVGGILIMPLGTGWIQTLIRAHKIDEENIKIEHLEDVRFVPLKGEYGVEL